MNREEKAAVIDQIAGELGASDAIFALDYRGITVAQIAELRDKLRAQLSPPCPQWLKLKLVCAMRA